MLKPAKKAKNCTLEMLQLSDDVDAAGAGAGGKKAAQSDVFSLFEQRRIRGFWPCYSEETGERTLTVRPSFDFTQNNILQM